MEASPEFPIGPSLAGPPGRGVFALVPGAKAPGDPRVPSGQRHHEFEGLLHWPPPRPPFLLDPPEPVRVVALFPEGPVLRLWWRGVERTIETSLGPEGLGGVWWVARESSRDYFRVRDGSGLWLWVFRDSMSNEWWVQGGWGCGG